MEENASNNAITLRLNRDEVLALFFSLNTVRPWISTKKSTFIGNLMDKIQSQTGSMIDPQSFKWLAIDMFLETILDSREASLPPQRETLTEKTFLMGQDEEEPAPRRLQRGKKKKRGWPKGKKRKIA